MTTLRTDIHRPSAIVPADYQFVSFEHLHPDEAPHPFSGLDQPEHFDAWNVGWTEERDGEQRERRASFAADVADGCLVS